MKNRYLSTTKAVIFVYCIVAIAFIGFGIFKNVSLIISPYPIEYRDATVLDIAMELYKGINTYTIEMFPQYIYVYGIIPPLLTSFFLHFFAPTIVLTNALCSILNFLYLFMMSVFMLKHMEKKPLPLIVFTLIFYSILFSVSISAGSKLSEAGALFMMMAVFIAIDSNYSIKGMICSCIASLIALHFKAYFVYSYFIICLYVFLFRSKRRGMVSLFTALAVYLFSYIVLCKLFPLYLNYSIFHHLDCSAYFVLEQMLRQILPILANNWFFFAFSIVYIVEGIRRIPSFSYLVQAIDIKHFSKPLLPGGNEVILFFLLFFVSFIYFIISMGGNVGSSGGTYYYQISHPFLQMMVLFGISEVSSKKTSIMDLSLAGLLISFSVFGICAYFSIANTSILKYITLLSLILFCFFFFWNKIFVRLSPSLIIGFYLVFSVLGLFRNSQNFFRIDHRNISDMDLLSTTLTKCENVYVDAYMFPYVINGKNIVFYNNGMTEYAHLVGFPSKLEPYLQIESEFQIRDELLYKYYNRRYMIQKMIETQELDCIAAIRSDEIIRDKFVTDSYEIIGKYATGMDQDIDLYVPKGRHEAFRRK